MEGGRGLEGKRGLEGWEGLERVGGTWKAWRWEGLGRVGGTWESMEVGAYLQSFYSSYSDL